MRKILALAALATVSAGMTPIATAAEELQFSPRIGSGRIEIDPGQVLSSEAISIRTAGVGGALTFVTPFWLLIEGGAATTGNFDWFGADEKYTFNTYTAALGLQYETANGFRLVPKYGRVRWKLYNREGAFANPGPEDESTLRGYDYFWEVTLAKKVKDSLAIGVTFSENSYDFGNFRNIAFTMAFKL